MAQPTLPRYSYEEYLERLEASEIRLEFVDGLVYAMAGGSPEHNRVVMRLTLQVGNQLKSPCEAYGPDQKIRARGAGYYPDLSVVCGRPQLAPDDPLAFTNPALVFEVLPAATAATDRTTKAERYKLLTSLQAYVIVSQPEQRLEVHRRTADGWSIETHLAGARVALPCGVNLVVSELYP
ncbi:MAG TPA: Uma2 family endonuclease [Polyangiaceae bacterium]|nr:Uma2 family endonuclease [Polyangiaceae bacterium]